MSEIVLTRIDDRLIHGQVMTAWVKKTRANQILIIDDDVANDDFMSEILKMSVPSGIDIVVNNLDNGIRFLKEQGQENRRLVVLVKSPNTIFELLEHDISIDQLIVGGMGARSDRRVLYKNISASDKEKDVFMKIIEKGVPVAIHIIPDQKEIDISKYL